MSSKLNNTIKGFIVLFFSIFALPANALLLSVTQAVPSSMGTDAEIILAPAHVLDDTVTNTSMQAFDEAQHVTTSIDYLMDDGAILSAGSEVNSHMIFLNSSGNSLLGHFGVEWTFDGVILGVMSDQGGTMEAASSAELGNPFTNYTIPFVGSGPAAPFNARGMESQVGGNGTNDGYTILDPYTLQVGMYVSEPGDWIRVITASQVPAPGGLALLAIGLFGLIAGRRKTAQDNYS